MAHEASEASTSPADILLRTITPLVLALAAGAAGLIAVEEAAAESDHDLPAHATDEGSGR